MSKAEKFIRENTRNCGNVCSYNSVECEIPWLTPDQARRAVEIAKEETVEKTLDFLKDYLYKKHYVGIMDLCDDYIKAMKDE